MHLGEMLIGLALPWWVGWWVGPLVVRLLAVLGVSAVFPLSVLCVRYILVLQCVPGYEKGRKIGQLCHSFG